MRINPRTISRLVRLGTRAFRAFQSNRQRVQGPSPDQQRPPRPTGTGHGGQRRHARGDGSGGGWRDRPYPGDYTGPVRAVYAPQPDGRPDPGEIVWTWVPYEEDHAQGKDRPVLLIGHDGDALLGLMLTSKDHDHPGHDDRDYVDIGTGPWDRQRRPSEAKLDRIIRVAPDGIRREGAVLGRSAFGHVAKALGRS